MQETRYYQDAMAKGETKGEAKLLLRLLERKFRPLPENARQRVDSADVETLLLRAERAPDAKSLDEIWGHYASPDGICNPVRKVLCLGGPWDMRKT